MLKTHPAVFAVEQNYQIMVQVDRPAMFWVRVGDTEYFDESNGVMCSMSEVHRVSVPVNELDKVGGYTVCVRPVAERKPYFTQTDGVVEYSYAFHPIPTDNVRIYHIADAHNLVEAPVAASDTFGNTDMLILNGDIIDHSGDPSKFDNIYKICSAVTKGEKPVIFSRGNHDMRGEYAEKFADYTPNCCGNTYYTFRLGGLWGMVLDCGEDKNDIHAEYGHTVCCHQFRRRQTDFIRNVIARKEKEYAAEGVSTRMIISHIPFTRVYHPPFDIEQDTYNEWVRLIGEEIDPQFILCGHTHKAEVWHKGGPNDSFGQTCPVVIGSQIGDGVFTGCVLVIGDGEIVAQFTDSEGNILEKISL